MAGLGIQLPSVDVGRQAGDLLVALEAVFSIEMLIFDEAIGLSLEFDVGISLPEIGTSVVEYYLIVESEAMATPTDDDEDEDIEGKESSHCYEDGVVKEGSIGCDHNGFILEGLRKRRYNRFSSSGKEGQCKKGE